MELMGPISVIGLMIVGLYEARQRRMGRRPGRMLSGTYADEVTAFFYGGKRMELEHRDSVSMMRDEEGQGAPPEHGVDLDKGTFRVDHLAKGTKGQPAE